MGTLKLFVLENTHFDFLQMRSFHEFLRRQKFIYMGNLLLSIFTSLISLFGFINRRLFRYGGDDSSQKSYSILYQEDSQTASKCIDNIEFKHACESDFLYAKDTEYDEFTDKGSPKCFLKFQFQKYEDFIRSREETEGSVTINKYEATNSIGEESFSTKQNDFVDRKQIMDEGLSSENNLAEFKTLGDAHPKVTEISTCTSGLYSEQVSEKLEPRDFEENLLIKESGNSAKLEKKLVHDYSSEIEFLSEQDFHAGDSDSESISSSQEFSNLSHLIDSIGDDFLSDKDFGGSFSPDFDEILSSEDFDEEDTDLMEELEPLHVPHLQNSDASASDTFIKRQNIGNREVTDASTSKNKANQNSLDFDSEESKRLETLWEHQELIEQLKMELRKVKATGLPTISEESETPKMMDDLKPWKIDEKFLHEDRMDELHKFYKLYRERMRKFDILNYQKMYALGLLQQKDPLQAEASKKTSTPTMTSIFSHNFHLSKHKTSEPDPMIKFMRELKSDLETVYVGQLCLSWEFLSWQYEKALDIWESDPHGIRIYNEVAGEFQQFQVVLQRFIENEPFQGPRVQNYVKNRCVLRNLLQIPLIREDSLKDRKKEKRGGRDVNAITSVMLVEILEESIRIFWRFVRADKDESKGQRGTRAELQDPTNSDLMMEILGDLHKKEKNLKELLRSGNCILRKFKRHEEDSYDEVLHFFSEVDMKLVSRVLRMSNLTTDQLVWCHNKLSKIKFVNRKIYIEPSFLLFPC